jgi:hypothetical protein
LVYSKYVKGRFLYSLSSSSVMSRTLFYYLASTRASQRTQRILRAHYEDKSKSGVITVCTLGIRVKFLLFLSDLKQQQKALRNFTRIMKFHENSTNENGVVFRCQRDGQTDMTGLMVACRKGLLNARQVEFRLQNVLVWLWTRGNPL